VKFIGDRLRRKEDPRLLTGRGRYVGDVALPGMLHAAVLRSPHAHARIVSIHVGRARAQAGVVDVITAADLGPMARELPCVPLHPALRHRNFTPLPVDRVRFVGEAVAVVVAASRYTAEDARDLIDVVYDPRPAAPGPEAALDPATTRTRVHDEIADNVAGVVTLGRGDVEATLARAPHVLSERFVVARGGGQPIETRGLVADYRAADGLLTVWASSQVPHQLRQFVCDALGLPPHRVRVLAPDVGGGFGAKLIVYPEDVLIPFLAFRLGRPVKWLEDRLEHLLSATQERAQVHDVTVAFDDEGRLLALRDRFVHDTGAYTPRGLVVPMLTASMLTGPYRIPAVEVTLTSVYTHRVPVTPYRGAGQPQAVFVMERVLDLVACATGRDPTAVRFANLVRPEAMPYDTGLTNYRSTGNVIHDSGDYPSVLRRALEISEYEDLVVRCARERAAGRRVGVGVACYVELTGVGPFEAATVRADSAGRIAVLTGATSQGQGLETSLAQVAADELGVTPDDVTVIAGDTMTIDHGVGTFASRAAVVGGTAVALAARELRQKCLELATRLLALRSPDDVQQEGTVFTERGRPERRFSLAQLAASAAMAPASLGVTPGLEATRFFQPEDIAYASGAHVVVVEVDPVSMKVLLREGWLSHDSGRLINPTIVEGQIQGAVALGLGATLLEELVYGDAGQPLTGSYMEYLLPTATDVPAVAIDHLETLSPRNPLGFKGVGEAGALPVAAAVAAAVEDALRETGVRITRMPLTPERLDRLLRRSS